MPTIQAKIDEYLKAESEKVRQRSGLWSPSSFGRCYRYQYWNRQNVTVTDPMTPRVRRVLACGKLFHDFVQQFFDKAQTEVPLLTDDISGRADLVVDDSVVDLKSVHSRQFFYLAKPHYDIVKFKYPNILQLMTYAFFLNKPRGKLVFISKDDLCIAEYGYYTSAWEADIQRELSILRGFWSKQELPPPVPRAFLDEKSGKPNEGSYCPYWTKCKEMGFNCPKKERKK